jgi:segregation and condensation protein B
MTQEPDEPEVRAAGDAPAVPPPDPSRAPAAVSAESSVASTGSGRDPAEAGAGAASEGAVQPPLPALVEAVLLVTDEPVPAVTLAQVCERPTAEVEGALRALAEEYDRQGRGFQLRSVAGGWRLYTREDCAPWVERFVLDGQQARLTQAALETLAVIAYRQPVTRARVSAVRGVNVDGVVRTLVARGLVVETGIDPDSGATLYGTTPLLLEKLGLSSLDDLPSLAPLLPEIDDMVEGSMST